MTTNTILTISMITNESLYVLENELTFARGAYRYYDDSFGQEGGKIGDTLNVRRPARFVGTSGANLNIEAYTSTSLPVVVGDPTKYGDQFHVDTSFTTKDLKLSLGSFREEIIKPAVATIANKIDFVGLQMAKEWTGNTVGTPGSYPNSLLTYLNAGAYMSGEAAPMQNRSVCIDQFMQATIVDSLKGLFTPTDKLGMQYKTGKMGTDSAGVDWYMDQNINNQTWPTWTTTASTLTTDTTSIGISSGWAQTSTITISAGATITIPIGSTVQIQGVYPVNPQNRQRYGQSERTFTVRQTVTGTGSLSLTVSPAIITAGQFQNVTIPTTDATADITVLGIGTNATATSGPVGLMYHKNAFTLAMVDLMVPQGVDFGGRASDKNAGLSIRVVRQYTINNDQLPARFDTLWGWAPLYQETATRIAS